MLPPGSSEGSAGISVGGSGAWARAYRGPLLVPAPFFVLLCALITTFVSRASPRPVTLDARDVLRLLKGDINGPTNSPAAFSCPPAAAVAVAALPPPLLLRGAESARGPPRDRDLAVPREPALGMAGIIILVLPARELCLPAAALACKAPWSSDANLPPECNRLVSLAYSLPALLS